MALHRWNGSRNGLAFGILLAGLAGCGDDESGKSSELDGGGKAEAGVGNDGSSTVSAWRDAAGPEGGGQGGIREGGLATQGDASAGGPIEGGAGGIGGAAGSAVGVGGSISPAMGGAPGMGGSTGPGGGLGGGGTSAGSADAAVEAALDAGASDASGGGPATGPGADAQVVDSGRMSLQAATSLLPVGPGMTNSCVNAQSFKRNALTSAGTGSSRYQFISYFNAAGKIVIGRRSIGASTWEVQETSFARPSANTTSHTSVIAVDGNGRLHLGWGAAPNATSFRYSRSVGSVLNNDRIQMVADDGDAGTALTSEIPLNATNLNNPEFYNIPGSGDLLLAYSTRAAPSNGDYQLARWDNAAGTWGPVHVKGVPAGANPFVSAGADNTVYPNQLVFDEAAPNATLHFLWTVRNSNVNNNVYHAQSVNQGVDWSRLDGTTSYGTDGGGHLMEATSSEPAYQIGKTRLADGGVGGFNMINSAGTTVDKNHHPVFLSTWVPNTDNVNQVMILWHDGTAWQTAQVTQRTGAEANHSQGWISRPIGVVDDDNRLIVVYRDIQAPTNGVMLAYSESPLRNDWKQLALTTDNLGSWEPTFDLARWNRDRVLDILYQPCAGTIAYAPPDGGAAPPVSVLEFDAKGYFAH